MFSSLVHRSAPRRASRVGGGFNIAPPLVEPDVRISRIRLSRRCRRRHAQLLAWPLGRVSISCKRGSGRRVAAKPSSVVGIAANRFSCRLTPHFFCKAPSLHGHYPLLSYYEPLRFPAESIRGYCCLLY